jgi:hypothetical protein
MSLIARMQSKFGRFAVPNLTLILILGQVFLYLAQYIAPGHENGDVLEKVRLVPAEVLNGQVWRLVTFLFDPPITNAIFAFFFWYMFYFMGTTLEANWGTFRYNIFLLVGYIACVAAAFIAHFATGGNGIPANNGFLYGTIFLAFARLYPDFVFYIMFILPVKIKWLALLQWIIYGLSFLNGDWMIRGMIAASVANYMLFFGRDIWLDAKHGHRRIRHQVRSKKLSTRIVHKCAVCGLDSDTSPQTQFRYCSKCDGELCYCPEHLQNHEHKSRGAAEVVAR